MQNATMLKRRKPTLVLQRKTARPAIDEKTVNRLLMSLSVKEQSRLIGQSELIELSAGEILYQQDERIRHVYFPNNCFISMVKRIDGRSLLVELIGNEGMLGLPLALGIPISPLQALVQGPGSARRMTAASFHRALSSIPALRHELNRYIYVLMSQFVQSAACNCFHLLDVRLARWLLMTHDRAHSNRFHLTHEILAEMLGVRRVGITNAAGLLQKKMLVSYSRGEITILDRAGLEAASCGCYQAAKDAYEDLLG